MRRGDRGPGRRVAWWGELRRAVLWHRRLIAAALAAVGVAAALPVLAPDPGPAVRILAASRDLAAGTVLTPGDLTVLALPPVAVPDGAIDPGTPPVDRVLAAPVRRGEPLTDVRFVGSPLIATLGEGQVATPIRIADAGAAALLRPGDVVDIIAASALTDFEPIPAARVVASGVRVISVSAEQAETDFAMTGIDGGALVVLATTPQTATDLAGAAAAAPLSVLIRAD